MVFGWQMQVDSHSPHWPAEAVLPYFLGQKQGILSFIGDSESEINTIRAI